MSCSTSTKFPSFVTEGISRSAPSVASPRNYSSAPHLSSPLSASSPPQQKHELTTPKLTQTQELPSVISDDFDDDQVETPNIDDENNMTLSDHTFQQLLNPNKQESSNNNINDKSNSNSFLVKLSSYLFNKNAPKSLPSDSTKAYTPQPLSYNTPNPPSTKSKAFELIESHPPEEHPPFEDYLGPIQFQSSLTQSSHKEFPRAKDSPTREPSTTSLYLQWDRDSSEQEIEAEKDANLTIIKPMWFLLALSGNETIAKLRREDFVKYVRVNVAARLSMQYDEVKVIRLQLSPRIMMNISIASARRSPVMALLAADHAPLLELSGEEFIIAPLEDPATAEQQTGFIPTPPEGSHDDLEAAVCALAAGACALAAGAGFLAAAVLRRQRPRHDANLNRSEPLRLPPAVIYTGRLENTTEFKNVHVINTTTTNTKMVPMDPRVQPDTLPLDARFVEELGLDNPNFLTP